MRKYVRFVSYCEVNKAATAVLRSRMADGSLPKGPIWSGACLFEAGTPRRLWEVRPALRGRNCFVRVGACACHCGRPCIKSLDPKDLAAVRPQILVGGFPCQDISVAGLRKGLAGDRFTHPQQVLIRASCIIVDMCFLFLVTCALSQIQSLLSDGGAGACHFHALPVAGECVQHRRPDHDPRAKPAETNELQLGWYWLANKLCVAIRSCATLLCR